VKGEDPDPIKLWKSEKVTSGIIINILPCFLAKFVRINPREVGILLGMSPARRVE